MCHLSGHTWACMQTAQSRGVRQFSCLIALLMLTAAQLRYKGMFLPLSTITPHFQTPLFFILLAIFLFVIHRHFLIFSSSAAYIKYSLDTSIQS